MRRSLSADSRPRHNPLRLTRRSRRVVILDAPKSGTPASARRGDARWRATPLNDPWPTRA